MKMGKRSFPKRQNCAMVLNSSNNKKFAAFDDRSTDSTNELSACKTLTSFIVLASINEVLLLKKNAKDDINPSSNIGVVSNLVDNIEDSGPCKSLVEKDRNVLASNFLSRSADFGEQSSKMNETEKKGKLTKKSTRKGTKLKRKSVDKGELNGSGKMQRQVNSNGSVFSSLFRNCNGLKEVQDLREQNISGETPRIFGKKRKRTIQKKARKIIRGGKVCLLKATCKIDLQTIDYSNEREKADEINEDKNMKNGESVDEEFKLQNDTTVYAPFLDGEEEETGNDAVYENFVKCYEINEDENVHGVVIDFGQKPFSAHCDSVQNGLDAFQWLIGSYDITQTIFQKKVLHVSRNNPNYYGNLFSTAKFIDILRTDYVEYGTNVNIAVYKNQQRSTLNGSGKVYPQEIQKSIKDGCSVQFTNPQSFCDNVWYYCDLLQEVFGCFVGANTYITPGNSAGFAPHWDDIDAFLLQLEGRKHWKICAPVDDDEMLPRLPSGNFTDDDIADRTPVFNDWLEQGDMLYIPRGFIHQGVADKDVHSLHLTVSVCRNVAYADLLEHIIPAALSNFAEQNMKIRKSLPAGYLDMMGVLECSYPLFETGTKKLHRFLDTICSNFCKYMKELSESAVDVMVREFMKTALPPVLTKEEKDMTAFCIAGSSLYDHSQHIFTKDTPIKLLRRHGQRLIYESEERCFIVHRMANSRVYEGRPEVLFDLDVELAEGFANLLDAYPHWCLVSDLKCNTAADSIRLAELLYTNGLLMAKFPKIMN
uniref:Bifunctional lysine-specific demethylase and histidyl-hydroxylase n=1 Tax=Elaeophora elaphi TaxID=1147741 RepID=A0A0R3RQS8_9BILA